MKHLLSIGRTVVTTWLGNDFIGTIVSKKAEDGKYDIQELGRRITIRRMAKDIRVI